MSKYCSQCGEKLNDNAVFCGKCGTRIGQKQVLRFEEPKRGVSIDGKREKSGGFGKIILIALILAVGVFVATRLSSGHTGKDEANFATSANGDIDDFDWYFNTGAIPDGERLTTLEGVDGGWKVIIDYTPLMYELGNISFTGTEKEIEAALSYSYHYNLNDGSYTQQNGGALYFSGKFKNGKMSVSGGGWTIAIDRFCTSGNKQYGLGQLKGVEGSSYGVALVRP